VKGTTMREHRSLAKKKAVVVDEDQSPSTCSANKSLKMSRADRHKSQFEMNLKRQQEAVSKKRKKLGAGSSTSKN